LTLSFQSDSQSKLLLFMMFAV